MGKLKNSVKLRRNSKHKGMYAEQFHRTAKNKRNRAAKSEQIRMFAQEKREARLKALKA